MRAVADAHDKLRPRRRRLADRRQHQRRVCGAKRGQAPLCTLYYVYDEGTAVDTDRQPTPDQWLLLVYRVPSEPTRLRATVWRRLKSLGAVYLQNSAAVLPAGKTAEHALRRLRREILDMEGSAVLLACHALVGGQDVKALLQSARDSEYEEILDKCEDFHTDLDKEYRAEHFTYGELEENEAELVKLRNWFAKVQTRDTFGAAGQSVAQEALDACEQALEAYAARVYVEDGDGA